MEHGHRFVGMVNVEEFDGRGIVRTEIEECQGKLMEFANEVFVEVSQAVPLDVGIYLRLDQGFLGNSLTH